MTTRLLTLLIASLIMTAMPTTGRAEAMADVIESDLQEITVTLTASRLHVTNAYCQTLQIFNVAGMCVMSIKVDSPDRNYDLSLPKGCYIVKVGTYVRKISVK